MRPMWLWPSMRDGITVFPARSTRVAPCGGCRCPCLPTHVNASPSTRKAAFSIVLPSPTISREPSNQVDVFVPRCACAATAKTNERPTTKRAEARIPTRESRLEDCIHDAPIPIDFPGLNTVEVIGLQEVLGRDAKHRCRFGDRWLDFAFFIRAA